MDKSEVDCARRVLRGPPFGRGLEETIIYLVDVLEGFLKFRRLGPDYLESLEFRRTAQGFWKEVADSMRPGKKDAHSPREDEDAQRYSQKDIRAHRRTAKDYLALAVTLASLGEYQAQALGRVFAYLLRPNQESPIRERLTAAGLTE